MRPVRARARRTDPATSLEAANDLEQKGKGNSQREACIRELAKYPDSTPYELAAGMGIDGIIPGKRLPELQKMGLAEPGQPRICRVRGTKARPWKAVSLAAKYEQMKLL